jgi:hypothetical protein
LQLSLKLRFPLETRVVDEKMNVVRGDHIVEHGQTEAFFCLEKPVQITAPMLSSADGGSFVFSQQRLERSEAVERLERLERDSLLVSEAVERLERDS